MNKRIVQEIESHFSTVDKVEKIVEQNLKRVEIMEQSILAKVFRGELVSQDPNDEPASALLQRIKAAKQQPKTKTAQQKLL
jgi:type I restriction enzyme S subunit